MTIDWGFDLQLEQTEDGYRATVLQSPGGEASAPFTFPFAPAEQHTIIQQLLADPGQDDAPAHRAVHAGAAHRRAPV